MRKSNCAKGKSGVFGAKVGRIGGAAVAVAALALATSGASAARIAADNAGNLVYNAGWVNGSNGGSGFGAWNLSGTTGSNSGSFHGTFVGNSGTNGSSGGPSINTSARAWGFYANTSNIQNNVRPFTADSLGSSALTVGQTLRFRLDNGNIQNGGSVGVSLQTAGGANRWELFFSGGASNYTINDGVSSSVNTGVGFTDGGLDVAFTVTGANAYNVVVTRLAGGTPLTRTASLIGSPNLTDIAQIRFFNFNAGSAGADNAYANSLSISKSVAALTTTSPTAYGSSLGSVAITGTGGNYSLQQVTGLNAERGFVQVSGFNPVSDTQLYALRLTDTSGNALSGANLSAIATQIGAAASVVNPGPFPSSYNLFLSYTGLSPMPNFLGLDFSTAAQDAVTSGVRISAIAVIPEPATASLLGVAALPLLSRRRRGA